MPALPNLRRSVGSRPDTTGRLAAGARLAGTMMSASTVQFTLGALAPFVIRDLGLTRTRLGLLVSAYYVVAGLASPAVGRLVGRIGGQHGCRIVATLALGGCVAVSNAQGQWGLAVGLAVAGVAVAAANPATNISIAHLPPPHGVLIGVKQSGFQMAAVLAGSVMPVIAKASGWRLSFVTGAALSAVMLLVLIAFDPPAPTPSRPGPRPVTSKPSREVQSFSAYAFFMGVGTANTSVYLVLYGTQRLGLPAQVAGSAMVALGLTSVAGRVGWNLLLERPPHRVMSQRTVLVLLAVLAIAATGLVASAQWYNASLLWVGAVALGASASSWNGVVMRGLVVRTTARPSLGRDSGRVLGAFFFGLATGPAVFGVLVDNTGTYVTGWMWSIACFAAAVVVALFTRSPRSPSNLTTHTLQREEI